jgi:serine/threonine protein kinase
MDSSLVSESTLQAEAIILTHVSCHRNIPHCFGVCVPKRALAMSLHLYNGQPLNMDQALYNTKFFNATQWLQFMYETGDALNHVHKSGILHNDIKLNNVILGGSTAGATPYLIDFGKACRITEGKRYTLSKKEIEKYKLRYPQIAPDLRDGLVKQSRKSDVYGYGLMLHAVLHEVCPNYNIHLAAVLKGCKQYNAKERPDMITVITSLRK